MKIEHIQKVCGTKAMPILVRAWSVLLDAGLCPLNQWPLSWDMEAMIAVTEKDEIAGVIGFQHQEWSKELLINIGYVEFYFRRRGVYQSLWDALVKNAQERDIPTITSGTALSNRAVREFSKKVGRTETRVIIDYAVPPKEDMMETALNAKYRCLKCGEIVANGESCDCKTAIVRLP